METMEKMMSYDHMTTKELKQTLVDTMTQVHGKDFALGWLQRAYVQQVDAATERQIAINCLNDMMQELV